jgi:hypothetical protein
MRNWQAKRRPHWIHWIEILLTAAVVAVAAVVGAAQIHIYQQQAKILKQQTEIMNTQAQIAEAQQRPWIDVNPVPVQDLTFDDSGHVKGFFKIKGTNIGTLPALDARAATIMLPGILAPPGPFPPSKYQEEACLAAESGEMQILGATVIDPIPTKQQGQTPTIFPQKDFLTGWGVDEISPRFIFTQYNHPIPKMLSALLTGCIAYLTYPSSSKWHHTKFAFDITTAKAQGLPFAHISDKMIRSDDLRFIQSFGLNTAD